MVRELRSESAPSANLVTPKKTTARFLRQLLWTGEDLATKVR